MFTKSNHNLSIKPITIRESKSWILKRHYAKRYPATKFVFGLFDYDSIIGCCLFSPVLPNVASSICGEQYHKIVLELSRLVVEKDTPGNTLSWFVSHCIKKLDKPAIILSYSDMNKGHHGYIYQACNFIYTGEGGDFHEFIMDGKQVSTRPQGLRRRLLEFDTYNDSLTVKENIEKAGGQIVKLEKRKYRYIYFWGTKKQVKTLKKSFKMSILPYPKGKNESYDVGERQVTQNRLF